MSTLIRPPEGGRTGGQRKIRASTTIVISFLFVLSALSFSGFVSAYGKHYTGPTGTCFFNLAWPDTDYTLGETMSIHVEGSFGHANQGWFWFVLKDPSGSFKEQRGWQYDSYPNGFTETVTYTLKTTDPTGIWTVLLEYHVPSKRHDKVTQLGFDEATVNPIV